MKRLGFISRHTPTADQVRLASEQGYTLVQLTDVDAFSPMSQWSSVVKQAIGSDYEGFIVVHPALAIRLLAAGKVVGVFENAQRAAEGGKPTFEAKALHIFTFDRIGEGIRFTMDGDDIGTFFS